ncbi:hypothetical protein BKH43_06720 [Helicobacter sp. 13S00401-1]|uniref:hypothetical protein n=1 Tax=Helicobacter sp. 13S00401-1 TaxID=1905758 RepID=UPI000BA6C193|nr:hypothetical protein [Helicobacter sp. 13S00401-1]PAF49339.1 hypothetical protein BKH43_06720 [Helicobacter sp. 13S00401-1]
MKKCVLILVMLGVVFAGESALPNSHDLFSTPATKSTQRSSGPFIKEIFTPNKNTTKALYKPKSESPLVYSVVVLNVFFENGIQKRGYGILLQDGYVLSSASLVNETGSFAKTIKARMQDDVAHSLMCVARFRTVANDLDTNLSLLEPVAYTDINCLPRSESFYHERINVKYGLNISKQDLLATLVSAKSDDSKQDVKALYPSINVDDSLFMKKEDLQDLLKSKDTLSLPLFSPSGGFLGLLSKDSFKGADTLKDKLVSNQSAYKFVCEAARLNQIKSPNISSYCR